MHMDSSYFLVICPFRPSCFALAFSKALPPNPPHVMRALSVSPGLGRISTRNVIPAGVSKDLGIRDYDRVSQPSACRL